MVTETRSSRGLKKPLRLLEKLVRQGDFAIDESGEEAVEFLLGIMRDETFDKRGRMRAVQTLQLIIGKAADVALRHEVMEHDAEMTRQKIAAADDQLSRRLKAGFADGDMTVEVNFNP